MGVRELLFDLWPYDSEIRKLFGHPKLKPLKNCLNCGKEHHHNNCFCSVECCKAYSITSQHRAESCPAKEG